MPQQQLGDGAGAGGGWGFFSSSFLRRPLHRFVAKTVAVTLVAGVAFHFAMEELLNTRGGGPGRRRVDEGGDALWAEEDEEERQRRRRPAAMGPVANQNLAFRRFLADLDSKDSTTKIEEATQALDYFVRGPEAVDADVKLRRVQRPTDPPPPPPTARDR